MSIGKKLELLRKSRNLTQEELAEALYVSRTAISKWESGRGYPNIESLKAIAKFFGVSISEEKEMVYVVAARDDRDAIMHAIMEKAGKNTDAHGVVFSLPVEKVVGIKAFE